MVTNKNRNHAAHKRGRKTRRSRVRRNYKDSVFRLLFSDKEGALELYNALNGSDYKNADMLEITTIDDVIYMGVKNDLSFLVEDQMYLVEEQSTWSPNMPLRGLIYFSGLYQGYVEKRQLDVYSRARVPLPRPVYVVFYNGMDERPEEEVLYLSDSFVGMRTDQSAGIAPVEIIVKVININYGKNLQLMTRCKRLHDYAYLIHQIRRYSDRGLLLEDAVDRAVEDCIQKNILKEFLLKHRGEVCNVILTRYDEKLHIRSEKALSFAEGRQDGMQAGMFKALDNYLARNPSLEIDAAARILGFNEQELRAYKTTHNCVTSII